MHIRPKSIFYPLAVRLALTIAIAPTLAQPIYGAPQEKGDEARLVGTWQIVAMRAGRKAKDIPADTTLWMNFASAGHRWHLRVARKGKSDHLEHGTWMLRGSTLTTRTIGDDREILTEKMKVTPLSPDLIELRKPREILVLKRRADK